MIRKFIKINPTLLRLYRYFFRYKWQLALAMVFMVMAASTSSLTATLLGKLTDIGFYQKEPWVIYGAPLALIGVTLLFAMSSIMSASLMASISQKVLKTIRLEMFDSMLHWPESEYLKHSTGSISAKFVNEASMALGGAAQSVIVLVRDVVQVIGLTAILFWHNWQLTIITLVVAPILVWILRKVANRVKRITAESQTKIGEMVSKVQEAYEFQRLVKISNAFDEENRRFHEINNRIRRLALKTIQMQSIGTPATQVTIMVAIAIVVAYALLEVQQGQLTFGQFITFLSAMLLIKAPIQHLAGLNGSFAMIETAAKSIFAVVDSPREKDDGTIALKAKGEIKFENVSFTYPGSNKPVIENLNLTVKPGETLVIMGESGVGKSTIANLIPRFWEISKGRILIDGIDIRDISLESLRRNISLVSQETYLFNQTLKDNLTYGLNEIEDNDLEAVLSQVGLGELVDRSDQSLRLPVGEGGSLLSGGQKQRLSIAYSLLKKAPILLFDEATSALDAKMNHQIADVIDQYCSGCTRIVITHKGYHKKPAVILKLVSESSK